MLQEYDHEFAEFFYYTPTENDNLSPFWLVRAGQNTAKPGYRIGPRRIECYSIHFVRAGSLMVEYKGQSRRLQTGDAFCLYPNRTYIYYKPEDEPSLQLTWLAMDGPALEKMLHLAGFDPDDPCSRGRWTPALEHVIGRLFEEWRKGKTDGIAASLCLKGLMYQVLSLLISSAGLTDAHPSPAATPKSKASLWTEYIEWHAAEGITVQQVAEYAGLNRTYFSTQFTRSVGMTPAEYIAMVKMDKAKQMLLGTSAAVTEIAYSLGYPTLFAFTRAFKNYCSMSPSQYRKQNQD
ncbi:MULTISPECIES: AraC family transcriptional regulator [Paenibacillus]|uniref:AraC family transcriptional regulator n=1 Tax=Paenibacillus albilobatus TaxID=2716884 RepID=A0A919XEK5_9BACL|nr:MULTISPECIES: AraC family transcriptional regulator [Paenibacillus]GIO29565.1 AraC family transcriptional regulator [Paenibacillus albilobatus]